MIRLFTTYFLTANTSVSLTENQHHYLLHVMRLQAGDPVLLFNGTDGEWQANITVLSKKEGLLSVQHQTRPQSTPRSLILCPALIKKEPMDWVFQKATELGVTAIYPLITERTVVSRLNLDRARLIVTEAAEQSERLSVPVLFDPMRPADLFRHLPGDVQPICLTERGETTFQSSLKSPAILIGPEGGWSPAELELFHRSEVAFWHLGDTILRAETAALAALACCQFG